MISMKRLALSEPAKTVRRKIELLDQHIDLPIARRALGVLEGDHPSHRRFGTGDVIDIHAWQPGDEARMMNWSASARSGQPMVSSRERTSSSHTWIIFDASINMNGSCRLEETLYEIASNIACFFAALSFKRHDAVSLLCADGSDIVRVPTSRNLSDFERNLDTVLLNTRRNTRNIDALIASMQKVVDKNGLVVLITDEYALQAHNAESLRKITQNHKLVVVTLSPVNPFDKNLTSPITDGATLRKIPAFFKSDNAKQETQVRRNTRNQALQDMLSGVKASLIHGSSSEEIFHIAAKTVSSTSYLTTSLLEEGE